MIGIYKITNKINGKVYIGQSWAIERRIKYHKGHTHNEHLKRAFRKYGKENFLFEVIKEFNQECSQILLDEAENFYIKEFDSINPSRGYNKKEGGAHGRMSEEAIKKRVEKNTGKKRTKEQRERISKGNKGKHVISEETRKKLSESHKKYIIRKKLSRSEAHKGVKQTEETKRKISEFQKKLNEDINIRKRKSDILKGKPWSEARRKAQNERKEKRKRRILY
jgi:group I intron endonuclease